jgi:hypothetical protein
MYKVKKFDLNPTGNTAITMSKYNEVLSVDDEFKLYVLVGEGAPEAEFEFLVVDTFDPITPRAEGWGVSYIESIHNSGQPAKHVFQWMKPALAETVAEN